MISQVIIFSIISLKINLLFFVFNKKYDKRRRPVLNSFVQRRCPELLNSGHGGRSYCSDRYVLKLQAFVNCGDSAAADTVISILCELAEVSIEIEGKPGLVQKKFGRLYLADCLDYSDSE